MSSAKEYVVICAILLTIFVVSGALITFSHENTHLQIFRQCGAEAHIEYSFLPIKLGSPIAMTVPDSNCATYELSLMARQLNTELEIYSYQIQTMFYIVFLIAFLIFSYLWYKTK